MQQYIAYLYTLVIHSVTDTSVSQTPLLDRQVVSIPMASVLERVITAGHLTGKLHNLVTSASSASSGHFPHKTEKLLHISDKAAVYYPHKQK